MTESEFWIDKVATHYFMSNPEHIKLKNLHKISQQTWYRVQKASAKQTTKIPCAHESRFQLCCLLKLVYIIRIYIFWISQEKKNTNPDKLFFQNISRQCHDKTETYDDKST